jgi:alpha-mannosidase
MTGHLNIDAAMRFSAEVRTPPVVLRDRSPVLPASGAVMKVLEGEDVIVGSKVAEDGAGVIVRLLNSTRQKRKLSIDAGRPLEGAWLVHPDERPSEELGTVASTVSTAVAPRCSASLLLKW